MFWEKYSVSYLTNYIDKNNKIRINPTIEGVIMRSVYREFLNLTEEEKDDLCKKGIYVFDTNVLLNLYRYSSSTRNSLLSSIDSIKDQIWMPNHIAYEFLRDRVNVIYETNQKYQDMYSAIDGFCDTWKTELRITEEDSIASLHKSISKWIDSTKAEHLSVSNPSDDSILEKLYDLYEGKTGEAYSDEKLNEIYTIGENRYAKNTPPGFKDVKKDDNKFGDLIIWFQMMDYCKDNNCPLVFVTNDQKEDWWQIYKGKKYGPRHELRAEFRKITNNDFHIYKMESFIELIMSPAESGIVAEIKFQNSFDNKHYQKLNKYYNWDSHDTSILDFDRLNSSVSNKTHLIDRIRRITERILNCEKTINGIMNKYEGRKMPIGVAKQFESTKNNLENYKKELRILNKYLL